MLEPPYRALCGGRCKTCAAPPPLPHRLPPPILVLVVPLPQCERGSPADWHDSGWTVGGMDERRLLTNVAGFSSGLDGGQTDARQRIYVTTCIR